MTREPPSSPYATKALLRAMAPVDIVIDSFLGDETNNQLSECREGEHGSTVWAVESQTRFASLVASMAGPKCTAFTVDWTNIHFLPSNRYISKLISRYVTRLEKEHGVDLEDDQLVSLVCHFSMSSRMSTSIPDPGSSSLLTFEIPAEVMPSNRIDASDDEIADGNIIQIRVFPHHNDVGLKLWEAGACLSEYLIQNPQVVDDKNVIELGAGVGLTGLIAAVCTGGAKKVHLTDYTNSTLENLRFNVEQNAGWLRKRGVDVRNITVVSKLVVYSAEFNLCSKFANHIAFQYPLS